MALHAGDQITAIKGKNEICHCTGEGSSGCQGLEGTGQARESAVRYFVIIIFSLFCWGMEILRLFLLVCMCFSAGCSRGL